MNGWVVRGLGLAVVHVVVRTFLGAAVTQWPQQGSTMRWISLFLVIVAALLWGTFDGIRDRRSHPDPDDGADLTMTWLKAAFVAGVVAGAGAWLVGIVVDIAVTTGGLFFELTSGAAFTVLLVFVPATIAVAFGRYLAGRGGRSGASPSGSDEADHYAESDDHQPEAGDDADSEWSRGRGGSHRAAH